MAEQITGQPLRTIEPFNVEPKLYYWLRTEKGADAEVDYVIQHHALVVPIEVKSGSSGSLKSLHLFMKQKELPIAARICSYPPEINPMHVKDTTGETVTYELRSIPFYLISELHRLLD